MSGIFPEGYRAGLTVTPPVATGLPATISESFSAALDEQRSLYNTGSLPRAMAAQYDRLLSALQPDGAKDVDAAGMRETFFNPFSDSAYEHRPWGAMQRRNRGADELVAAFWERFDALPEDRKAALGDVPKSRDELEAAVRRDLQAVRSRQQEVSDRAGVLGTVAGFAGAMVGSLEDPITLGSMALGAGPMGAGATAAARVMVTEALINGAAEAATLPTQAATRRFIGDPMQAEEAVAQVLIAAGLGAGLAGVAVGARPAARKASELIARASDAELAAAFRKIVKRPGATADAAAQTLERAVETADTVPAEISPATLRTHEERAAQAEVAVLDGAPVPDTSGPGAVVARAAENRIGRPLSGEEYDRLVRTVAGEALVDGESGMRAVAHVILNRLATGRWGDTVDSVVLAPRQFEPWGRPDARASMEALTPETPAYRAAAAAVDAVLEGRAPDPTGGALNFLNPTIVEQRRGTRPVELDRPGRQIGRHWFWNAPGGDAPARVFRAPVERFDPRQILTDAEAYQFKAGGDTRGVTDRLVGVEQWDDLKAGTLILHERLDGTLYVADGHQRLGLAQRLAARGQEVMVDARVLRESEGVSIEDARAYAAAKNIAEGTGTAVDAAKVLRIRPELLGTLPPRSTLVRQGNLLRRLADEPFGMVVNEVVPPGQAALVAERAPADEAIQANLMRLLAKVKPETERETRALIDEAIAAGFGREVQTDMFGALDVAESYIVERAKVRAGAVRKLAREERVFKLVNDEAARIREAGNVLQESENARRARVAAQAEELLDRLADRKGPVGEALDAAARRARADGRTGPAIDDFVGALRSAIDGDDRAWLQGSRGGDAGRAAPEDGALPVAAEPPQAVATAPARLPDEATLSLFDQPAGPAQKSMADELEADVMRTAASARPEIAELARTVEAENAADREFLAQLDLVCGTLNRRAS